MAGPTPEDGTTPEDAVNGFTRPPSDPDAERAFLGGLLTDGSAIIEVADRVKPDDLYRPAHRLIYAAMLGLFHESQPLDVVTVAEALQRSGDLESVGGAGYLSQLGNDTPTAIHTAQYGAIVVRKAVLRRLIGAAGKIAAIGYEDSADVEEAIDRSLGLLMEIQTGSAGGWRKVGDYVADAYEHVIRVGEHGPISGLSTGIRELDILSTGLQPGEVTVIAARPGVGKSALGFQIAQQVARSVPVGWFGLEMSNERMTLRALAGAAGINLSRAFPADGYDRLARAMSELGDLPIYMDDTPSPTITELLTRARRLLAERRDLGLLCVDYLQLAVAKAEIREQEVAAVSRGLHQMARDLRLPVIALAQLGRGDRRSETTEPSLRDLRESGAIEADADNVWALWRPKEDEPETVRLLILKARNGPSGVWFDLHFNAAQMRFYPIAEREPEREVYWEGRDE